MADDEYNKKLESLQQYIPFLNNMIKQLRDPRKKNREQQLAKMVSLHSMITDKKKRLKLETLAKCEDVILKLYEKVKTTPLVPSSVPSSVITIASPPPATPCSPSPPRDLPLTVIPVVIPTEKVNNRAGTISEPTSSTYKSKIDIYSCAADSLMTASASKKLSVFERLGTRAPDMSRPPISFADLEIFQEDSNNDVDTEAMSLHELTDLREKLQRQLSKSTTQQDADATINTTVRNSTILTKKAVEKTLQDAKLKAENKLLLEKAASITQVPKVVKDDSGFFGSALNSIDKKMLENDNKQIASRWDKETRTVKDANSIKKDKLFEEGVISFKGDGAKKSKEKNIIEETLKEVPKKEIPAVVSPVKDPVPVYKRLADKYNPKPRKTSIDTHTEKSIEPQRIKAEPLKSPPSVPGPVQTIAHILPQASPEGSTDSEVSSFNRMTNVVAEPIVRQAPLLQTPQPVPPPNRPWHNQNQQFPQPVPPQFQRPVQQTNFGPSYGYQRTSTPFPGSKPRSPPRSDRDYRYRESDSRNQRNSSREFREPRDERPPRHNSRDPRIRRDPRSYREEHSYRREPREYERDWENRSRERETRTRFKDTIPNKYSWTKDDSTSRSRDDRSRSNESNEADKKFISPLDSLYTGGERKTGKGYGVQNYKIPKIKKEETDTETKTIEDVNEVDTPVNNSESDVIPQDMEIVNEPEVALKDEDTTLVAVQVEEQVPVIDDSQGVTSSTEPCDVKPPDVPQVITCSTPEVAEISSTNDIGKTEDVKPIQKDGEVDQTNIINNFLKKLLDNERTRAAASAFIDNVSHSLDDDKLQMIVQTVKEDQGEEEYDNGGDDAEEVDEEEDEEDDIIIKKPMPKSRKLKAMALKVRKLRPPQKKIITPRRKSARNVIKDSDEEEEEPPSEEKQVIVSVGERIKSRKRLVQHKKKKPHRTELDLLHEDIHGMFIRDGVLTATGKRMCRLLKDNDTDKEVVSPRTRRTRASAEKFDAKLSANSDKFKAMSNVRVLIPKLSVESLTELEDDPKRYSLRKSNKFNKSYAEDSDDEKKKLKSQKVVEEIPKEEKVEETPSPKKVVKKRAKSWASGVLPKRRRKEPEKTSTESESTVELVEPDKNYYTSKPWSFKYPCKLCDYFGGDIAKHYRFKHPDSEVLSSRLSPAKASMMIAESLELKLDEIPEERTRKTLHQCRVCDLEMAWNFYDHLTTHTGEYRHSCNMCSFCACNGKTLKSHYAKEHTGSIELKARSTKSTSYGYICVECNYFQLERKSVENHVNIYHLDEGEKILKIRLVIVKNSTDVHNKSNVSVTTDDGITEPEPKKKKIEEIVPKSPAKTVVLPVENIKKEKEIDMTVFTCKADLQEDNEKIKLERLKKMTELNESVRTSRQSLNFIDQLSTRLLEEKKLESEVIIKSEPVEEEEEVPTIVEEIQPMTPRKPSKVIEEVSASSTVNSVEVAPKENISILDMIEKLKGILKYENDVKVVTPPSLENEIPKASSSNKSSGNVNDPPPLELLSDKPKDSTNETVVSPGKVKDPPPLELLSERLTNNSNTILSAGFLQVNRDSANNFVYACRVPSCLFATADREEFKTHWNLDHVRINQNFKFTICRICGSDIRATAELPLLQNFFQHVEQVHLSTFNTKPNVLGIRRLSGDQLSTSISEEEDNPFGFKITTVVSLAEDSDVPPLCPIQEPKPENVVLAESRISISEKQRIWKSPEAFEIFLEHPKELYKCPSFFCTFFTIRRYSFEAHVKTHNHCDELVCCVYCDVKTPLGQAGLHIDMRHSSCLYSCSKCLYRALTKEYVIVHMKAKHEETDLIISLQQKCDKALMKTQDKMFSVKEACEPFVCGHKGCFMGFLYKDDFSKHLLENHEGMLTCGYRQKNEPCGYTCSTVENMLAHYRTHNSYNFHCLICKMGCMELHKMLEHYSLTHPNLEPAVVDRRVDHMHLNAGYSDIAFSNIRFVTNELFDSINSAPNEPEPIKCVETPMSLSLIPLSLMQPGPSEKKLIAILPKPGPQSKLTAKMVHPETSFIIVDDSSKEMGDVVDTSDVIVGDPLSFDDSDLDLNDSSTTKNYGLLGYQLYRCAFCQLSFSNSKDFKSHCMQSQLCVNNSRPLRRYTCVHCKGSFSSTYRLVEHIQYHGPMRFSCSLCVKKFPSSFSIKIHMRNKHNVVKAIVTPLVPGRADKDRDEFVFRPTADDYVGAESNLEKTVFGPSEIDLLPTRYIFTSEIRCAQCSYCTKVRTNMVRHLQFHSDEKSVPDIAPVNPVPCLDKNEKMFDKMTNLALSSIASTSSRMGGGVPKPKADTQEETVQEECPGFIPSHRRYVCCAVGCNYLCLEEGNLRHHLFALHEQESSLECVHCQKPFTSIDDFIKHLKLHESSLYKCSECVFHHNLRHKVEKHLEDKHSDAVNVKLITIRSQKTDESSLVETPSKSPEPKTSVVPQNSGMRQWRCGICKYRCITQDEVINHVTNKHHINTQYKCTLCSYKTDEMLSFPDHFKNDHPDNGIDVIRVYYKKENEEDGGAGVQKQFDHTPLWQRDRPRVRHIRGILFEESSTSPQKTTKKIVPPKPSNLSASTSTNLDLAIDAVAKGTNKVVSKANEDSEKIFLPNFVVPDDDDEIVQKIEEYQKRCENFCLVAKDNDEVLDVDIEGFDEDEDIKDLSEQKLEEFYGPIETFSTLRMFVCPICTTFTTKLVATLVKHVIKEKHFQRYRCQECSFEDTDHLIIRDHMKEKHDIVPSKLDPIPLNKKIVFWLQLLVTRQAACLISTNPQLITEGKEAGSVISKVECRQCSKWFYNSCKLREHELQYWANPEYICPHCATSVSSLDELFMHHQSTHPTKQIMLESNKPCIIDVLFLLKIEDSMKKESSSEEADEDPLMVVKTVSRHKPLLLYCCTYCHYKNTAEELKRHIKVDHVGLNYNVYQYICMECTNTFGSIQTLRKHFTIDHPTKKLTYSAIENKLSDPQVGYYQCVKCPFQCCSIGGIRNHVRKHLRPTDCLLCEQTFMYPADVRNHHNREHPNLELSFIENKDRLKEYEELIAKIMAEKVVGVSVPVKRRMFARKSTGAAFIRGQSSNYGQKPDMSDLEKVTTETE